MSKLMIQSGDFLQGEGEYDNDIFTLKSDRNPVTGERIPIARIKHVTLASQETSKNLGSALKWGLAGALVLGPVGLMVGIWLGGKSEEVTFIATLKDGRKLMAITDGKTYSKLAGTVRVFP
jgi:hypothetical protein